MIQYSMWPQVLAVITIALWLTMIGILTMNFLCPLLDDDYMTQEEQYGLGEDVR